MKKIILFLFMAIALCSCGPLNYFPPCAVNTVNTAQLSDLNLQRADYEILNTITAEASISYYVKGLSIIIEAEDDFTLEYILTKRGWSCKFSGIPKYGFLSGDYNVNSYGNNVPMPETVVRQLAIYRAINIAKEQGADAIVEPTIATNMEQQGRGIMLKTIVTAKIIKLKTDR